MSCELSGSAQRTTEGANDGNYFCAGFAGLAGAEVL